MQLNKIKQKRTVFSGRSLALWIPATLALVALSPGAWAQNENFSPAQDVGGARSPGSWGDINADGYAEFLTGRDLYLNIEDGNGGRRLKTVREADSPVGGVFGDYNNDGRQDVFNFESQRLFENDGNGAFTLHDQGGSVVPNLPMDRSRGASWSDFNNDGRLDIYVSGYEDPFPGPAQPDVRLRNDGASGFTKAYTQDPAKHGRGVTTADYDSDGDGDTYVSNYRIQANQLHRNNGDGTFSEVAAAKGVEGDGGSGAYGNTIGSAWGDLNNDGLIDLFVGNFAHPRATQDRPKFYKNLGPSQNFEFEEVNQLTGSDYQESYASPSLADYDNDGDLDLFYTTVYNGDNPRLYRNDGDFTFTNVTSEEGLDGLDNNPYQASWADYDHDGDLDLITNGTLFENDASANDNNWLEVALEGDPSQGVNRDAIGAQVKIDIDLDGDGQSETLIREVAAGTGEGNQNQRTLHFGFGDVPDDEETVDLEIRWPGDSTTETITDVDLDQFVAYARDGSPITFAESFAAVPEPASALLLGAGSLLLAGRPRRRGAARA